MKKFNCDLIIFDLDGTIANTREDICNAVNFTLKNLGHKKLSEHEIISCVGDGLENFLLQIIPEIDEKKLMLAIELFRKYYTEHILDKTKLYPNVEKVLISFNKKRKVVLSNKPEDLCKIIIKGLNVSECFDYVYGGDSFKTMKPDAYPINYICDKLKIKKSGVLMIGDGYADMLAAKASGVKSCAVTYGFSSKEKIMLHKPDYIVNDIIELGDILQN